MYAASHLCNAHPEIQARQVAVFRRCDREYGDRVEAALRKGAVRAASL